MYKTTLNHMLLRDIAVSEIQASKIFYHIALHHVVQPYSTWPLALMAFLHIQTEIKTSYKLFPRNMSLN